MKILILIGISDMIQILLNKILLCIIKKALNLPKTWLFLKSFHEGWSLFGRVLSRNVFFYESLTMGATKVKYDLTCSRCRRKFEHFYEKSLLGGFEIFWNLRYFTNRKYESYYMNLVCRRCRRKKNVLTQKCGYFHEKSV